MTTQPGWYPGPNSQQLCYFDGARWLDIPPPPPTAAVNSTVGVVVAGPNHPLHAILSILTFWCFGGWLWVWLLVALNNRRRMSIVDASGSVTPVHQRPGRLQIEMKGIAAIAGAATVLFALHHHAPMLWAAIACVVLVMVIRWALRAELFQPDQRRENK